MKRILLYWLPCCALLTSVVYWLIQHGPRLPTSLYAGFPGAEVTATLVLVLVLLMVSVVHLRTGDH